MLTETPRKPGLYRRLRLRRADGRIFLDRWGVAHDRIGGVLLHRMSAPDPGIDLHDHPWSFVSIVLWGGYVEHRALVREAPALATIAEAWPDTCTRGVENVRRAGSLQMTRLDEAHTVSRLLRRHSWSLVLRGPRRRGWGFYLPTGYMDEHTYDRTIRAERRDLWNEFG